MNIFMQNYGLIFLAIAGIFSLALLFISLFRSTISPDYQKRMLVTAAELDAIEVRTRGAARRRLRREIEKGGF